MIVEMFEQNGQIQAAGKDQEDVQTEKHILEAAVTSNALSPVKSVPPRPRAIQAGFIIIIKDIWDNAIKGLATVETKV